MSVVGERLRIARERSGLKQTQVKARTGINNKTLSGYEHGVSEPDVASLTTLATLYGVTVDWLLGRPALPSGSAPAAEDPEQDFIRWVKENVSGRFFYDFEKDPEESKRQMMADLRYLYERDRKGKK